MRIERHRVGERRLRRASEDFAERIDRAVDLEQHGERSPFGWQEIGEAFLDYAGARCIW